MYFTPGMARQQLVELLARIDDQTRVLHYMPKWMTLERLFALIEGDRRGRLSPLQTMELAAILEIVPAMVAALTGHVVPDLQARGIRQTGTLSGYLGGPVPTAEG